MYLEIQKRWGTISVFRLILCFLVILVTGACTTNRRVIKNETLDVWDGRRVRYKNLFWLSHPDDLNAAIVNRKEEIPS